jgi:hypothetical protein
MQETLTVLASWLSTTLPRPSQGRAFGGELILLLLPNVCVRKYLIFTECNSFWFLLATTAAPASASTHAVSSCLALREHSRRGKESIVESRAYNENLPPQECYMTHFIRDAINKHCAVLRPNGLRMSTLNTESLQ